MEPATMDRIQQLIDDEAIGRFPAIGWVLARIRERPAYTRLLERARELDELKARF